MSFRSFLSRGMTASLHFVFCILFVCGTKEGGTQASPGAQGKVFPFSKSIHLATLGKDVPLTCTFNPGRNTSLEWTKNDELINFDSPDYVLKKGSAEDLEPDAGPEHGSRYQQLIVRSVTFPSQGYYGCYLVNDTGRTKTVATSLNLKDTAFGRIDLVLTERDTLPSYSDTEISVLKQLLTKKVEALLTNFSLPPPRLTPIVNVSNRSNEEKVEATILIYISTANNPGSSQKLRLCEFLASDAVNSSDFGAELYNVVKLSTVAYDCCTPVKESSIDLIPPLTWPLTLSGTTATSNCLYKNGTKVPMATASRKCLLEVTLDLNKGAQWQRINDSSCPTREMNRSEVGSQLKELEKTNITQTTAKTVVSKLTKLTEESGLFGKDEFNSAVNVFSNVVDAAISDLEIYQKLLETASKVLETTKDTVKEAQVAFRTSTRLLDSLENMTRIIPLPSRAPLTLLDKNIGIAVWNVDSTASQGAFIGKAPTGNLVVTMLNSVSEVKDRFYGVFLTPGVIKAAVGQNGGNSLRGSGYVFNTAKLFSEVNSSGSSTMEVNSDAVFSAILGGVSIKNSRDPIFIFLPSLKDLTKFGNKCAFWDLTGNAGYGKWSFDGCTIFERRPNTTVCECNHLTNFALLVSPDFKKESVIHQKILSIIAYVGCIISSACLILAIITLIATRHLRRSRPPKILLFLCISLLLTLLIFLLGVERTEPRFGCRIIAILTHYFLLSTFMWTALEGLNLYLAFVKVFALHVRGFLLKAICICHGVPAIIVAFTAGLRFKEDYGAMDYCVVTGPTLYFAWLLPAALVVAVNFLVLILVIRSLHRSNAMKSKDTQTDAAAQARIIFSCAVLMGLCWVFGMVAVGDARLVFQYIFSFLCAFQGLFIFVFQCAFNKEIQKEWVRWYNGFFGRTSLGITTSSTPHRSKDGPSTSVLQSGNQFHNVAYSGSTSSVPLTDQNGHA